MSFHSIRKQQTSWAVSVYDDQGIECINFGKHKGKTCRSCIQKGAGLFWMVDAWRFSEINQKSIQRHHGSNESKCKLIMKIICIGRNYADHAKELGNAIPKEPVIFLKPDTALLPKKNPFFIPDFTNDLHHELELVVRINRVGKSIEERFAHRYYNQVTVGIDFTARDIQRKCKENGLPWEKAKAFDGSAPDWGVDGCG